MTTQPIKSANVFGVYDCPNEADGSDTYQVSRTGIIVYPTNNASKDAPAPQVISMVNGSMCINPLGEFICSVNFDDYLTEWVTNNKYRFARFDARKGKAEPGIAYFDPDSGTYVAEEPEWHKEQFLSVLPDDEGDPNYPTSV